jgi:Tol biopolymer transport system component
MAATRQALRGSARKIRSIVVAAAAIGLAIVGAPPLSAVAQTGPTGLIAFAAWDAPDDPLDRDIFVLDPASSDPAVNLTGDDPSAPPDENPSWSPDGSQIAFDSFRATNQPTIHVMNADGSGITRISSTPCCDRDFQPAWSPDGERIAFVSTRDGDGEYEIYVMNDEGELAGPPATRLTNDPMPPFSQGISDSQPTWSPDSSRIAFMTNGRGANADSCDLFVMNATDADADGVGDNLTRITFDDGFNCDHFDDMNPSWSPNSSLIAFDSPRNGDFEVWVVDADNPTDIRNVTENPGYDGQPTWSADGTEIFFVSSRSGTDELWSAPVPPPATGFVAAAAATATQITNTAARDESQPDASDGATPPVEHSLTVTKAGTGSGTVRSTDGLIICGADCSETYPEGTVVTLTAQPGKGSTFTSWSGDCSGTATTCQVTMDAAHAVTATFTRSSGGGGGNTLTVSLSGAGSGLVTSNPAGISCPSDCSENYATGTAVMLRAAPRPGSVFAGWSGACTGSAPKCAVTMSGARSVTARFALV